MRLVLPLLLGLSLAWAQDLHAFLAPLQAHPAVEAVRAQRRAAALQLDAAYDPMTFELSGGFARVLTDPADFDFDFGELPEDWQDLLEEFFGEFPVDEASVTTSWQLSTAVVLRPFIFGDIADLVTQRELGLAQATLLYREILAGLEAQALEAALNVRLAERVLELAQEGVVLAEMAQVATEVRLGRGAASERERREVQQSLQEATNRVLDAEADLALARMALAALVGEAALPELPVLRPVTGTSPEVLRGEIDVALAQLGVNVAERDLLPVAQLGYTYNPSDRDSLGFSLETRTLQPRVSYILQDPPRGFPQSQVRSSFSVGMSMTLSDGRFKARDAATAQRAAADASLAASRQNATIQQARLENELARSARNLALAEEALRGSERSYEEARAREALGITSPLETQQAWLSVYQARLSLYAAQVERYRRLLETYRAYAVPLSEVYRP